MAIRTYHSDHEPTRHVITDAIGQGVDIEITRVRGIVSVVLIDSETGEALAASAEIEYSDLCRVVDQL